MSTIVGFVTRARPLRTTVAVLLAGVGGLLILLGSVLPWVAGPDAGQVVYGAGLTDRRGMPSVRAAVTDDRSVQQIRTSVMDYQRAVDDGDGGPAGAADVDHRRTGLDVPLSHGR
jgi:hypothetical protein